MVQDNAMLKGIQWSHSDLSMKKMKKMLWGREALRVFHDKLKRNTEVIKECKKSMEVELKRVSDGLSCITITSGWK
jgi:hypothetical protein